MSQAKKNGTESVAVTPRVEFLDSHDRKVFSVNPGLARDDALFVAAELSGILTGLILSSQERGSVDHELAAGFYLSEMINGLVNAAKDARL